MPAALAATPAAVLAAAGTSGAHDTRLIVSALIGIAVIITLITFFNLNPFLSLTIGSVLVGGIAGLGLDKTTTSFGNGVGSTVASVGTLIALGAIFGKLLADSGGADQLVDTIVGHASDRTLPWAMGLVGMVIGLPVFFEIGLVLLMPVILLVARRSGQPLMRVAIPTLAGLSAMHGFVPPHPGPLAAIGALNANLGQTLALGIICAVPAIVIGGPLFATLAARWVDVPVPELFGSQRPPADGSRTAAAEAERHGTADDEHVEADPEPGGAANRAATRRPGFGRTLGTVLTPIVLMLAKAIADVIDENGTDAVKRVLDFVGTPLIALLLAVLLALFTLGVAAGLGKQALSRSVEASLPPIAGILLIVAAGGGFKQVLTDSGISKVIASWVTGSTLSPLLLAWFVAVLIRLATGSATVATVTTAGILQPVTHSLSSSHVSLMVLAIGAGSVFFSHVNDAGFWLTKQYFGLSVGQNLKSWSLMETVLSVTGLGMVLALSIVV